MSQKPFVQIVRLSSVRYIESIKENAQTYVVVLKLAFYHHSVVATVILKLYSVQDDPQLSSLNVVSRRIQALQITINLTLTLAHLLSGFFLTSSGDALHDCGSDTNSGF